MPQATISLSPCRMLIENISICTRRIGLKSFFAQSVYTYTFLCHLVYLKRGSATQNSARFVCLLNHRIRDPYKEIHPNAEIHQAQDVEQYLRWLVVLLKVHQLADVVHQTVQLHRKERILGR